MHIFVGLPVNGLSLAVRLVIACEFIAVGWPFQLLLFDRVYWCW